MIRPRRMGPRFRGDDASRVVKKFQGPFVMLTETTDYAKLYRDFRWNVPARFNIATVCCDRHADGTGRLALTYVDEQARAQRTSFDEMRALSSASANVLKASGPARGDLIAVLASQSP